MGVWMQNRLFMVKCSATDGEEIGIISVHDYSELVNKTDPELSDV